MRILSPSLPELHAFIAVVETGSFSRAAQRLSVTQGAISRAVLRLEARLEQTLFERRPGGVQVTPTGQGYYERIHKAVAALEDAVPQKAAPLTEKVLHLSVIPTFNIRWLVPRLPQFHACYPGVRIVFKPYRIEDDLLGDDVDCWIRLRRTAASRWPRHIKATYVTGKDLIMICHPSLAAQIRRPADVLRFELLHHANYPGNWALWLQAHGVDTTHLRLGPGFDLGVTLIEAVEANMGVAVIQRCLIERELAEQRVVTPIARQVSTGRGYYLCASRARTTSPQMDAFRSWLFEQVKASNALAGHA